MAQKEKKIPDIASEKKCDCGPECDCGCNEGKECHCENHHGPHGECCCGGPHHGPHGECCCGKRCGGKFIILLLIFLAGMGFNELLHGCFGRCSGKAPHGMPAMHAPLPHHGFKSTFTDGAGTVIIINAADGQNDMMHYGKKHHKCHKGEKEHHHADKKDMKKMHRPFIGRAAPMHPHFNRTEAQNDQPSTETDTK